MRYRERHKNDRRENCSVIRIPVAKALQMPESTLPVDPYVYGLWLGNGNTVKPEITICTRDVESFLKQVPYEITNALGAEKAAGAGFSAFPRSSPSCCPISGRSISRMSICALPRNSGGRCCKGLWTQMGALARERRRAFYVSTIKGLADNVRELLWSLGIKNAMTEEPSTRYGVPTGETLYTIRFTTFEDQPTSTARKEI